MNNVIVSKSIGFGLAAALGLLALYFSIVTIVSTWSFALRQFSLFWPYLISLAAGFGAQIGLYAYTRQALKLTGRSKQVLAVSGTMSTAAMISCCAHYLVYMLPILGITGVLTVLIQYQIQFFWVGILANLLGISYILRQIFKMKKSIQYGQTQ